MESNSNASVPDDNSNKENIPPPASVSSGSGKETTNPVSATAVRSAKKTFRRRSRTPLADISNLFVNPVQISSSQDSDDSKSTLSCKAVVSASCRKRKVSEEIDFREGSRAKSLRMGFR